MKLVKVFDRFDMPKDIQKKFENTYKEDTNILPSNDSYVDYDLDGDYIADKDVTEWLLNNGANKGDKVLIRWWW
jgi:hypothetical protein